MLMWDPADRTQVALLISQAISSVVEQMRCIHKSDSRPCKVFVKLLRGEQRRRTT
jgi:hypothetical protein